MAMGFLMKICHISGTGIIKLIKTTNGRWLEQGLDYQLLKEFLNFTILNMELNRKREKAVFSGSVLNILNTCQTKTGKLTF